MPAYRQFVFHHLLQACFLFLHSALPSCKRCTQKEHFSITPLERTVTSGFNTILERSSFIIIVASEIIPLWLSGKLSASIISPVKTAYFIRTVIGTISCTNTTVISHLVNPFAAMVGCRNRANIFTRSIITMLAKHRLKNNIRIFRITGKIPVDTKPMHIMIPGYFIFTYNRNIIFSMTGNYAGAATGTGIKINAHSPFIPGLSK